MDVLSRFHLYQMSSDSGMFENPFREGGKLSRDAEVIIDALKTGKLSVISNQVRDKHKYKHTRKKSQVLIFQKCIFV